MFSYEVINHETDESHGKYETLDEARGAVRYDRLKSWSLWSLDADGDLHHRIEQCVPYSGDDDRAKQGLGQ